MHALVEYEGCLVHGIILPSSESDLQLIQFAFHEWYQFLNHHYSITVSNKEKNFYPKQGMLSRCTILIVMSVMEQLQEKYEHSLLLYRPFRKHLSVNDSRRN